MTDRKPNPPDGKPTLRRALTEGLRQLTTRRHVTVLSGVPGPIRDDDPCAIVSRVPHVRIEPGSDAFQGRRTRLRFDRGASRVTILARTRPLPPDAGEASCSVQWARDRFGRRVPVSCADHRTRTIHVLVQPEGATVIAAASEGTNPMRVLAASLLGRPLEALLRDDGPPHVGSRVPDLVRGLLALRPTYRRDLLQEELTFLQRLAGAGVLPEALARRLTLLQGSSRRSEPPETPPEITSGMVELEVSRLERIVSSRACAALRFGEGEIRGLLNPRPLDRSWRLRPIMFRFQSACTRRRPVLSFWDPHDPEPPDGTGECLGSGVLVFHRMECAGDVYGTVDAIINFVETNRLGAAPANGRPRRRFFSDLILSLL